MVLAEDVFNLDGHVLFTEGTTLTERLIEVLLMWGVPHVEVVGKEDEPHVSLNQFEPDLVRRAEALVAKRFQLVRSSHPAIDVVRKISILETAKTFEANQMNQ